MWNEMLASRGACEVASCVMYFLNKQVAESIDKVAFYSDNCGGQNRNKFIASMYMYVVYTTMFESIQHNYLENGRTQNENDSIHATIENEKKHTEFVYVPSQYYTLARSARKSKAQYRVKEMKMHDFYNFNKFSMFMENFKIDNNNEKVKWGKILQILIERADPFVMQFKYDHDDLVYQQIGCFSEMQKTCIAALSDS